MRKFLLLILATAALMLNATIYHSNSKVYIKDFAIAKGQTKTVNVIVENTEEFSSMQCDIKLPTGLAFVDDLVIPVDDRVPSMRDGRAEICDYLEDGSMRCGFYNTQRKNVIGNSGAMLTFDITTTDDFDEEGSQPCNITISTIKFSDIAANKYLVADTASTVYRARPLGAITNATSGDLCYVGEITKVMGIANGCAFVTDGKGNWLKLTGDSEIMQNIEENSYIDATEIGGTMSNMDVNPTLTLASAPATTQTAIDVETLEYDLKNEFHPQANEVMTVTGFFFDDEYEGQTGPALYAYSGQNGPRKHRVDLDFSAIVNNMETGVQYKIDKAIVQLKNPWPNEGEKAPRLFAQPDPAYYSNYVIMPLSSDNVVTAINDVEATVGNIKVANGTISVEGATNVSIYGVDGRLISTDATTDVPAGIYVVVANGNATKVIVK